MTVPGESPTVAIVGGGPAGLGAASALLDHGASVTLIDESGALGGQYYKHFTAAPGVHRSDEIDHLNLEGLTKASRLRTDRLTVRANTLVWALFPDRQMALYADDEVELLRPDAVVLAPGAVERIVAFPGWTLPGVMTAGAAQTLVSREAILPGRRFLLAGTGPLLLAIALEIAEAGGEVVAVVEGSRFADPARHVPKFIRETGRIRQFVEYRMKLRRRGIPVLAGKAVVAARGDGHVREAIVSPIDRNWSPLPGSETRYEIDTLCLHYGFEASTELARLAGCEVAYARERGGWYVAHDNGMRSTRPGIYVAGQGTGIGGADLAEATGRIAGLSAARDLGLLTDEQYEALAAEARGEVERGRRFAEMLNLVYAPRPGIADLVTRDTIVCRCEEVQAAEVNHAIEQGGTTLNDVKRYTRCGMGFCQGRICGQVLVPLIASRAGVSPADAGLFTARPPVKPVPLGALARMPDPEAAQAEAARST